MNKGATDSTVVVLQHIWRLLRESEYRHSVEVLLRYLEPLTGSQACYIGVEGILYKNMQFSRTSQNEQGR